MAALIPQVFPIFISDRLQIPRFRKSVRTLEKCACVADFTTPASLKLVDLRTPRKMVSPFLLADAVDIGRMRNDLPFLERLGNELTRPVIPQSAAIDYTPSQYLCEFIKEMRIPGCYLPQLCE